MGSETGGSAAEGAVESLAEKRFAENLRALREEKGISQTALADAMTARGWSWRQPTVARLEAGLRMVRYGEAVDLAEILHVTLDRFAWLAPEAAEHAMLSRAYSSLRTAWEDAADAICTLYAARSVAEAAIRDFGKSHYQRVRDTCAALEDDFRADTPKNALAEGRTRYQVGDDGCPGDA